MNKRSKLKKRKKRARQRALLFLFSTASMVLFTVLAVKAMTRQEIPAEHQTSEIIDSTALPEASASMTDTKSLPASPSAALQQKALKQLYHMVSKAPVPAEFSPSAPVYLVERKNPLVPLVVVDPGHGGEDEGCSFDGITEKDINLSISLRLEKQLTAMGYEVLLTRRDDTFIDKNQRVEMANAWQADIYVSIHQNTFEDSSASGIEAWYCKTQGAQESGRLANLVHQEALSATGAVERELQPEADFVVNTKTFMPSCLIETGFLSNPEERTRLNQEDYQEKLAEGIAKGINSYFHPKTMYLTFDDGPSEENTNAVLDVLKDRNIKATFFLVGENVRKHPNTARRIAAEGHTIGIHCNSHDYQKIYQSADAYIQDFEDAYNAVLEVTGVKVKLYRFPGGSINAYNKHVYQEIIDRMTANGFTYFDWNASLEDTVKKSDPEELVQNARNTSFGRDVVVLLAHDIVHSTALSISALIDQFPEYKMEPLDITVEPMQFNP